MAWHTDVIPALPGHLGSESLHTMSWTRGQFEQDQGQLCAALSFPYNPLPSRQVLALGGRHHISAVDPGWEHSAHLKRKSAVGPQAG